MISIVLLVAPLSLAALLYSLLFNQFYVGFLNDDALYIGAARSLLQGHYQALWTPGHPPLNAPVPGFPLFLMPWVALAGAHLSWLRLVPIVSTLISGYLLWLFAKRWLSPTLAAFVMSLFLFNPTTLRYSTLLVAEPTFLCIVLLVLLVLPQKADDSNLGPCIGAGLLLGWAALFRPEGVLLIIAAGVVLIYERRWRLLAEFLVPAAITWGGVMFLNYTTAHHANGYVSMLAASSPVSSPTLWLNSLWKTLRGFIVGGLWGVPFSQQGFYANVLVPFLIIASSIFIARGFARARMENTPHRTVLGIVSLFILLYLVMHSFWLTLDLRYSFPLIPFLTLFLIKGIRIHGFSVRKGSALLAMGLVLSIVLGDLTALVQASPKHKSSIYRRPAAALDWMRNYIPAGSCILTDKPEYFYLENQVLGLPIPEFNTEPELYAWLRRNHIPFAVVVRQELINRHRMDLWIRAEKVFAGAPMHYKVTYDNPDERIMIYEIKS
jgi:hypothetical protein